MSMPFDATLKSLARDYPADFLTVFDRPPAGPLALLNVDLSTVTTAADGSVERSVVRGDGGELARSPRHSVRT
jgi:hypothetical protein